jgi:exopolyphosphatase/guanosine-5'-triphosphate,3'-diphosphate pyrophosphatase
VRLRERFLKGDPPTTSEIADATALIDQLLDSCGVDFAAARTWLAVGGAATCLAAINLGLERYDRSRVHGAMVSRTQASALASRLASMRVAEVAALPTMQPRRADVIAAGALINARIGVRCLVDERVSEADILDGIVLDLLARA